MTNEQTFRALVVDDEIAMQKMLVRGLVQQGFRCETADDGDEAIECIANAQYDVVVTDLKMPNKHGHALALHLLSLPLRPAIIIHTGIIEPRLAKDLLSRGVDDIVFKPYNFGILAAKARALAERRRVATNSAQSSTIEDQAIVPTPDEEQRPANDPLEPPSETLGSTVEEDRESHARAHDVVVSAEQPRGLARYLKNIMSDLSNLGLLALFALRLLA